MFLSFENNAHRTRQIGYFLPKVQMKDDNVMIDEQKFFDQLVKNDTRTYDNIGKVAMSQRDDYTTDCLLDYPYFKENYMLIGKDLNKKQALDAHPKAIQQISFTGSLSRDSIADITDFFIIEEAKETALDFSERPVKVL